MGCSMDQLVLGILAAVDAGKTTLSEAMLYQGGTVRSLGRVDTKDAFLDHFDMERERGITIFSKQAMLTLSHTQITLLDTPGHVDFSAEMERTLQVLDAAVLVISGPDGIQTHTKTLWNLLKKYRIPVFLFVNKMDQCTENNSILLKKLNEELTNNCIDFTKPDSETFFENISMCEEELLEQFLEGKAINRERIQSLIKERKIFPCYFGAALRLEGVLELMDGLERYAPRTEYEENFGAKVFKIARDNQGNRLTYLKITGGKLRIKDSIAEEKVNQIRRYSGEKYESLQEASAGMVCAVTGLSHTHPGEGLGAESASDLPIMEPVLSYCLKINGDTDARMLLPKLRILEEEIPELQIVYLEEKQEIHVKLMGEIQIDVMKRLIFDRFGVNVDFVQGSIVYKETIENTVEGIGHFEPLRHYAEVHLIMEPLERGSGLQFASQCSEDVLNKNWQRLVLTHLEEREHKGVLTGSPITDVKITIVSGRAHTKHTEGGDFRQATYRAVRQGLMQAQNRILEPVYEYRLEIPDDMVGRAMTDLDLMSGSFSVEATTNGMTVLTGRAPVSTMNGYMTRVSAYTKGRGKLNCVIAGYDICHNEEEVMEQFSYDPLADIENPSGSVFCIHGAGVIIPWNQVEQYMHLPNVLTKNTDIDISAYNSVSVKNEVQRQKNEDKELTIDLDEIDAILERTFHANRKDHAISHKGISAKRKSASSRKEGAAIPPVYTPRPFAPREEYLLVDGYNVIFAWTELKELAAVNIDGARGLLMDILCNYQSIKGCSLILVFDAYRVEGHKTEQTDYHNIHVVYTKEAETADQYIEHFAHEHGRKYNIKVATSDGLEQIIIRGQGCQLISSRELKDEIERTLEDFRNRFLS